MEIHICSITEYNIETRMPTIENPNSSTFYLVPTEDGISPDLFIEWVYVNGAWEMFGSVKIDLSGYLTDVQINGTSIVSDGVANVPIADSSTLGAVRSFPDRGTAMFGDRLVIYPTTSSAIKNGGDIFRPIVPSKQHESTFYGLAKAAGDTTQSQSSNAVGQYTDEAKASIQTMLGVPSSDDVINDVQINGTSIVSDGIASVPIANIPSSGVGAEGVVKLTTPDRGLNIGNNGELIIAYASDSYIKSGTNSFKPITPTYQHKSVFYGLTKAAGVDMSTSSNPVGTYTPEAKSAIKQMLSIADNYDSFIVDVEGTDPTITGQPSYRYNCGEVLSLTVTPPETGTIDFRFTSGSSPTVLTLPSTVKMPEWWVEVEANTIYEMCITDGVYCGVMSWAM